MGLWEGLSLKRAGSLARGFRLDDSGATEQGGVGIGSRTDGLDGGPVRFILGRMRGAVGLGGTQELIPRPHLVEQADTTGLQDIGLGHARDGLVKHFTRPVMQPVGLHDIDLLECRLHRIDRRPGSLLFRQTPRHGTTHSGPCDGRHGRDLGDRSRRLGLDHRCGLRCGLNHRLLATAAQTADQQGEKQGPHPSCTKDDRLGQGGQQAPLLLGLRWRRHRRLDFLHLDRRSFLRTRRGRLQKLLQLLDLLVLKTQQLFHLLHLPLDRPQAREKLLLFDLRCLELLLQDGFTTSHAPRLRGRHGRADNLTHHGGGNGRHRLGRRHDRHLGFGKALGRLGSGRHGLGRRLLGNRGLLLPRPCPEDLLGFGNAQDRAGEERLASARAGKGFGVGIAQGGHHLFGAHPLRTQVVGHAPQGFPLAYPVMTVLHTALQGRAGNRWGCRHIRPAHAWQRGAVADGVEQDVIAPLDESVRPLQLQHQPQHRIMDRGLGGQHHMRSFAALHLELDTPGHGTQGQTLALEGLRVGQADTDALQILGRNIDKGDFGKQGLVEIGTYRHLPQSHGLGVRCSENRGACKREGQFPHVVSPRGRCSTPPRMLDRTLRACRQRLHAAISTTRAPRKGAMHGVSRGSHKIIAVGWIPQPFSAA